MIDPAELAGPGSEEQSLVSQLDLDNAGITRNRVSSLLLEELLSAMEYFEDSGFEGFREDWQKLDLLAGEEVELEHNGRTLSGRARGVDENGGLVLETRESRIRVFHSGEVSIHRG